MKHQISTTHSEGHGCFATHGAAAHEILRPAYIDPGSFCRDPSFSNLRNLGDPDGKMGDPMVKGSIFSEIPSG